MSSSLDISPHDTGATPGAAPLEEEDGAAILRRRAAFVASALAGVGLATMGASRRRMDTLLRARVEAIRHVR